MDQYDTNGDGVVKGEELEKAPALKAALPRLDTDGDGGVSAAEVAERVKLWSISQTGLILFSINVTLDGQPLQGATVTYEPEKFLGDAIKTAVTNTDSFGGGGPSIPKEQRPGMPPGVHIGLYKVKISRIVNGKETIPAKYNEATTLGQEVSPDAPELANLRATYSLSSK